MRMEREVVPSGLEAESDHDSGVAGAGSVMDDWPVTVVPLKTSETALEVAHETVTGWPAVAGWGEAERAVMVGAAGARSGRARTQAASRDRKTGRKEGMRESILEPGVESRATDVRLRVRG